MGKKEKEFVSFLNSLKNSKSIDSIKNGIDEIIKYYGGNTSMEEHEDFWNKIQTWSDFEPDHKHLVVVWSGGMDSTALLYCLAHKYPETAITALSVNGYTGSRDTDKKCREQLKKRFKKENLNIEYVEVDYNLRYCGIQNGGIGQPLVWLAAISSAVVGMNNKVCFGYIRGDDIWHYKEYFKNVFYNMRKFVNSDAELSFPLEFITKEDIIAYLKQHDLFDLCNCCEHADNYDGKGCGTCKDCKAVKYYELESAQKSEKSQDEIQYKRVTTALQRYKKTYGKAKLKKQLTSENCEIKGIGKKSLEFISNNPKILEEVL